MKGELNDNGNFTTIWLSFTDFQELTNQVIAPNNQSTDWRKYLSEMFKDIQTSISLDDLTIMSTRTQFDIGYLQNVTKLISNTATIDLNSYIWCDIVSD